MAPSDPWPLVFRPCVGPPTVYGLICHQLGILGMCDFKARSSQTLKHLACTFTCSGGSWLPCPEDTLIALWRGPCRDTLRPQKHTVPAHQPCAWATLEMDPPAPFRPLAALTSMRDLESESPSFQFLTQRNWNNRCLFFSKQLYWDIIHILYSLLI